MTAIAPALREVDGVADVVASGGRRRVLEVELDDARARALGLDPEQVRATIASLDLRRAGGAVEQGGLRRPLALHDDIESVREILDAPVVSDGRRSVRLRDVAVVHDTYEEASSHYRVDGRPAVTFEVFRAPRTNVVQVAADVRARVADPASAVAGVRLILDEDQSEAIRAQMSDLRFRALIGAAVIFLVLLLFLRSFRSAVVVFATIAFSILITLNLIHFSGLTLNMLTLMGLAMGFGLIDRQRDRGAGEHVPPLAAGRGAGACGGARRARGAAPGDRRDGHDRGRRRTLRLAPGGAARLLPAARDRRRLLHDREPARVVHLRAGAGRADTATRGRRAPGARHRRRRRTSGACASHARALRAHAARIRRRGTRGR